MLNDKLVEDCCNEVACDVITTILENEKIKECVWNMIDEEEDIDGETKFDVCFNHLWNMILEVK